MNDGLTLEQRYRRALRLLPAYYRAQWEEDMVAAFMESSLAGDQDEDEYITEFGSPSWPELASVASLAARLYLGGAGAPGRYFARGQAVRNAVLAVMLIHALRGIGRLVALASSRGLIGWLPPPASVQGGIWPTVWYIVGDLWIVSFFALVLGHFRIARAIAALAIVPGLAALLESQLGGTTQPLYEAWAYWVLLCLVPVLAMAAFHQDAPPVAHRPWLLALPVSWLLVPLPVLVLDAAGRSAWVPDFPGLCCLLAAVACLAHTPRAASRKNTGSGAWSLALMLLAVVAAAFRVVSLAGYPMDPHLVQVGLGELAILLVAAALVAPDAARAAGSPSPQRLRLG